MGFFSFFNKEKREEKKQRKVVKRMVKECHENERLKDGKNRKNEDLCTRVKEDIVTGTVIVTAGCWALFGFTTTAVLVAGYLLLPEKTQVTVLDGVRKMGHAVTSLVK